MMKVFFEEKNRQTILSHITDALGGRKLADMVSFDLSSNGLTVTISKLGTSTLSFSEREADEGLHFDLKSEKIAFTHRAFKDEVTAKIVSVIEKAGGKVT